MKPTADDLQQQVERLRQRVSTPRRAFQRVSASLDLGEVLQEIVETARKLTGASAGVITTVDGSGRPREFVSAGLSQERHQQLAAWLDGASLFERLRDLPGALTVRDAPGYLRSLGFSTDPLPCETLQVTPMRYRDAHLGTFFLAYQEGGREFTDEDEEVRLRFASQAATAIVNARTCQDERRARAGLEALVETSPVGVSVFDARNGTVVSLNREATRIVECLRSPDQSVDQLIELVTVRRADGREVAPGELRLVRELSRADTVRAEEITMSVPDGRSVRMLVNATPIHGVDGEVESVVVTMQDLAPLEELERMRAQFLDMVSHELRAPLISIKGSTATVLGASPVPDAAEMMQFFRVIDEQADHMRGLIADLLDQGRIEAGMLSVSPEPAEVASLIDQARNTFVTGGGRNAILVDLAEDLPLVMADRQRLVQVLNNLLFNAARHSADPSPIRLSAARDGVYVTVRVADEGRGVPPDRLPHLFQKIAAAAAGTGKRGGFGLGLVICRGLVEAHGGRIWAESDGLGRGTRISFTLPVAAEASRGASAGAVPDRSRPRSRTQQRTPILVVDDDPEMLRYVRDALSAAGYAPFVTGDPSELPQLITTHRPRLVLLDLRLPDTDGIELMDRVPELADLPVIFISACGRDETVARALAAGAADYIVKPFSPMELTARVRAVLRRQAAPEPFVLGALAIGYEERRVTMAGRPVKLTATEYELLRVLSLNAGRVMTYAALLRQGWRRPAGGRGDPKLVRAVVKRLRHKLGDDVANPAYVLNERGVGYAMPGPGDR